MIIRHAEKPDDQALSGGIDASGAHDNGSLTVRGWQRAGALAQFFMAPPAPLDRPSRVDASNPSGGSQRPLQTVSPLTDKLGEGYLFTDYTKGKELELASAIRALAESVLVCWQHERIIDIAKAIMGDAPAVEPIPEEWPDVRFDLVWVLSRSDQTEARFHSRRYRSCCSTGTAQRL